MPRRSSRNRIALGCSLAACVASVYVAIMSIFVSVTYQRNSWGYRLQSASLMVRSFPGIYPSSSGLPPQEGFILEEEFHPRIEFFLPQSKRYPGGPIIDLMIPLWPLPAFFAAMSVWLTRRRRGIVPGHCSCGYSLQGNQSGICPECGGKVKPLAAFGSSLR